MRVTEAMRWEAARRRVLGAQERLLRAQERLTAGRRLLRPMDDPAGAVRAMRLRRALREEAALEASAEAATRYLAAQEEGLRQALDALQAARTAMVRVASGTLTQEDRASLAGAIRAAEAQVADAANSAVAGRHVFAGARGAETPVTGDGSGGWLVLGVPLGGPVPDPGAAEFDVGTTVAAPKGTEALAGALLAARTAGDVAEDTSATSADRAAALAGLDAAIDGLILELARVGGTQRRVDAAVEVLDGHRRVLGEERSGVEDLDMAAGAAEWALALVAYQAAMAVAARPWPGLAQYLG